MYKKMAYGRKGKGGKKVKRSVGLKNLANKIKTISLRNCETKVSSKTVENLQLTHNGTYYENGLLTTSPGVNDPHGLDQDTRNRVGDEIIARGMKLKWWVSNKLDRPNVMYNIYVFWYNTLDTPTSSIFWCGTDGLGGTMNRMLDRPNPERIKVIKKIVVNSTTQFGNLADGVGSDGREHSYYRECWIPMNNKKIQYRRDTTGTPKNMDIGFAIVPYDAYGTLTTANIASFAFSKTLYFKDP